MIMNPTFLDHPYKTKTYSHRGGYNAAGGYGYYAAVAAGTCPAEDGTGQCGLKPKLN